MRSGREILLGILVVVLGQLLFTGAVRATNPAIANLSSVSGPVGMSVAISGTGFGSTQGTSSVTFNGTAANSCSACWSDTAITVTVPAGATTGNVIVNVGGLASNGVSFTVTALPTGWTDADVGTVGLAGSGTFANGMLRISAAGHEVTSSGDSMNFAYQSLSGDGTFIARLISFSGSTSSSQAGLMIRATLDPGAANFFVAYQNTQPYYSYRSSVGGVTSIFSAPAVSEPTWLMLVRSGSTFSAYSSPDGVSWSQISTSQTITMPQNVYVGLAASSGSNSSLATANFDGISFNPATAPGPVISTVSATTASIGAHIQINGSGFGSSQGGSTVYLADSPVSVNSWSATTISITIPSGAISGFLYVSVAPTMNDSNGVPFEVTSQPLPTSWLNQDVGPVGLQGSATFVNPTFTVKAAGHGITSTSDGFQFVYQILAGDGTIVARVSNIQGSLSTQAGVMIRESLAGNARYAFSFFQPNTAAMYYRSTAAGSTSSQTFGVASSAYPYWIRVSRSSNVFTSYISLDGVYWTQIGTTQLTMAEPAYIGLAVSSESTTGLSTVTFDNVSVDSTTSPAPTISSVSATTGSVGNQVSIYGTGFGASQNGSVVSLNGSPVTVNSWTDTALGITIPTGGTSGLLGVCIAPSMNCSNTVMFTVTTQPLAATWLDADVGKVGLAGSATYANGAFTVKAAGQPISNTADGFHFVYQYLSGNGSIVARVSNIQSPSSPQIGVMIRESVEPNATNAFVYFVPNGAIFDVRPTTGASTTQQSAFFTGPSHPYWVKLVRNGSTFTGYVSEDATNWTQSGTQTISMAQNVLIGLATTNGTTNSLVTATFDGVAVSSDILVPPTITSVSATTGSVGAQVNILGSAFGLTQGSSTVLLNGSPVIVNSWSPTAISLTIPTGATSGYLEVALAPSMNSSNPVTFDVTSQPLPAGWLDGDVGAVGSAGSASYSSGTFTVNGVGKINGTADAMHFVYQPLVGDGVIIARVSGVTGGDSNTQLGVMIRETLNAGSSNAFIWFYPNTAFSYARTSTGASTSAQSTSFVNATVPYWVKVARTGNTFSTYISATGTSWTQIGTTQTISMAESAYAGLVLANWYNSTTQITAQFDNVSIVPGTMPMISGISPASGGIGTQVTVSGSNFGSSQGSSSLNFNGTAATSIASWSNTQIVANVTSTVTPGPVTVVVGSLTSNTNYSFAFYNPVIASVSPTTSQYGGVISVVGSGFGALQLLGSQVLFNGTPGFAESWSDTSISVALPPGATSGPMNVTVGGVTSNSVTFAVENLSVSSISPTSGPAGTLVTITGAGFGSAQTNSTVDFYGTVATIQSWSDTQIVAVVPAAPSGSVNVTVGGLEWFGPQFTMTRLVQLTDSNNNQSSYTSALIGGMWVPFVGAGSGCSTCTQRGNISFTYDSEGNVLSRTDENGHTSTYTYDANGNVLTATAPINSTTSATTTYTYNNFNEVLTSTDPLGNVTTNTYDSNGNLLTVTTPAPGSGATASVTRFGYDSKGELTTITDPLGNQTSITYFGTGLIQTVTDAQSHVTTYAYDSKGNRTSVTDANSQQTTFTYDAMNRLTKITYPDTTTSQFAYDSRGRRTSVTDQNGKTTSYAYDDADRLTTVTDAASNVTTYGYDSESNLTSIQDANSHTTSFTYDAFGRVTKTTFPSGYIEQYGYDAVGNLTSKTDRNNQQITYTYDQLNRLTQKAYPDTTAVNYAYDNDSRLIQVSDPTGTYSFTFDNMGRLTNTTTAYAFLTGRNFTTAYNYDAASNRTGFTDPESGSTAYAYDTLNRLQALTPPAAFAIGTFGFTYDVLSRRTQLTRPNSITTNYNYDNLSRLLSVLHKSGSTTLDGATYTLDSAGNRTAKADQLAGVTSNYTYDPVYELTQVTQGTSATENYSYDPVGNRLSSLGVSSYTTNSSNELTSTSSATYIFDDNGNTTSKTDPSGTTNYTWDFENRLTAVTLPASGGSVSFKYDPFGRRIYKSSSASTSIYAYDGNNLVEETNAAGAVVARYARSQNIDEPLAMLRSGATSYYHADGLGSVTSLSNAAGSIANTYTYDSFGKLTASTGSLVNPFQYTARESDPETGLYYYRARYYDPQKGRFLNEDPIRFAGSVNFYSYVSNNPVVRIDPSGLIHQAWNEKPYDGRLHDDPGSGLEVLCTKGRNKQQDIWWLQQSIAVRFVEIVREGENADLGHIGRLVNEAITLKRCQDTCENEKKPEPEPAPDNVNEQNWWQQFQQFIKQNPWLPIIG